MLAQEIATKYSHALFLSAKEKGLIDKAYDQFKDLKAFIVSDSTLLNFLKAPQVLDEHKLTVVRDVFSNRIERLFVEFLVVLITKHRIAFLPEIIEEFTNLVEAEKGIGRVTVTAAVPLSDAEKNDLVTNLAAKTGLKIKLEEKVDPNILAGLIVTMRDEIIDGSVRRGLNLLEQQLAKVRVV